MAINVSVHHSGGCLPGYYTVNPLLLPPSRKNPFKCHEEVLYLQPMISPNLNVLTYSPPWLGGGCSEGLDAFRFFFKLIL